MDAKLRFGWNAPARGGSRFPHQRVEPRAEGEYGDSGGPNFLGSSETNVIAATTITGHTPCRSTNVDYRLDTPSACSFLANYVTLP